MLIVHARTVGLIPAAGRASRLPRLPCSKEILPVGYRASPDAGIQMRLPICDLLDAFRNAGIEQAFVGLRMGKWDIPSYLANGDDHGVHLAYVPLRESGSVVETICALLPFVGDRLVAFGFPDILFYPPHAFSRLVRAHLRTGDELVLGLFPTNCPKKSDMVEVGDRGRVKGIEIKPVQSKLRYMWGLAVWTPRFSERIAAFFDTTDGADEEMHVGHVFRHSLSAGIPVSAVQFPDACVCDIGTPEELLLGARNMFTSPNR